MGRQSNLSSQPAQLRVRSGFVVYVGPLSSQPLDGPLGPRPLGVRSISDQMGNQPDSSDDSGNSHDVIVRPKPAVANISPLGFHRYASEFYAAAQSIGRPEGFSPVPYYLYCRSLELALKAYLLANGVSKKRLKGKFGHDLEKALRKAESLGLSDHVLLSSEQHEQIAVANGHYKSKAFEYFQVPTLIDRIKGRHKLPDLDALGSLTGSLLEGIEQVCIEA